MQSLLNIGGESDRAPISPKRKVIELPPGFVPNAPSGMSTEEGAQWICETYISCSAGLRDLQYRTYTVGKKLCGCENEEHDLSVSIFQSAHAWIGKIAEKIQRAGYVSILSSYIDDKTQRKVIEQESKRDIDHLLCTRRAVLWTSVTTIPQERKDHTWLAEATALHDIIRPRYKKPKAVFLGLFFGKVGKKDCEKIVTRTVTRKQRKLGPRGHVISGLDARYHAEKLQEIVKDLI